MLVIQMALLHAGLAAPTAADLPAATDAESIGPTLLQYIRDGGLLSYVLIGLSIFALTIVIRNLFALRLSVFAPRRVVDPLERLLEAGQLGEAQRFCQLPENECFIANVMNEAISRCVTSEFGVLEFRSALEEAAQAEGDEVHRMNDWIGICAAIGPMLGLLGTVFGMIGAFRTIGTLEGSARSNELATFMSMALVNTAEGLIVAIPCTVAFALFRRRIDRLLQHVGRELERCASLITSSSTRPAEPRRAAPVAAAPRGAVR